MRLGAYPCKLEKGSLAFDAYAKEEISERHRHRYEFNNKYLDQLKKAGLVISGLSPDGELVEIVESRTTPGSWAVSSIPSSNRPAQPHPLFTAFIAASFKNRERRMKQ